AAAARAAGVHPVHASRLFARHYGQSVTSFAQHQAVRRAMNLLTDRARSLSMVAMETGFYDQSHMSRVFRRVLGRTPLAVRRCLPAAG
ncbi:MAG: helix-turn-helix domain-containing protein, partial [Pseudomonadota bacterium]